MDRCLIIVSRNRPNLFQHLSERESPEVHVILDRRETPRPTSRASGQWHRDLERHGYVVVVMA